MPLVRAQRRWLALLPWDFAVEPDAPDWCCGWLLVAGFSCLGFSCLGLSLGLSLG